MRTIEASIIFPFILMVMTLTIFLCFDLHDMVLCKAAGYKFLVSGNTDSEKLETYLDKYSLLDSSYSVQLSDDGVDITSASYKCTVEYSDFNKCDLLRKCSVANDLINTISSTD